MNSENYNMLVATTAELFTPRIDESYCSGSCTRDCEVIHFVGCDFVNFDVTTEFVEATAVP